MEYERYKTKSKPIIVKEKLCYYQLTHRKTHNQNFYKFVLEMVPELILFSKSSANGFS